MIVAFLVSGVNSTLLVVAGERGGDWKKRGERVLRIIATLPVITVKCYTCCLLVLIMRVVEDACYQQKSIEKKYCREMFTDMQRIKDMRAL